MMMEKGIPVARAGKTGESSPQLAARPTSPGTLTETQYLPLLLNGGGITPLPTPTATPPAGGPDALFSVASYGATITETLEGQSVQCLVQTWLGVGHSYTNGAYSTMRLYLAFPSVPVGATKLVLRLHRTQMIGVPFNIQVRQGQWSSVPPAGPADCVSIWRRPGELGPIWGSFTVTGETTDTISVPLSIAPVEGMPVRLTLHIAPETDEPSPSGNGLQVEGAEMLYEK